MGMLGAAIGNSAMTWGVFLALFAALRGSGLVDFDLGAIGRVWASTIAGAAVVALPLLALGYPPLLVPPLLLVGVFLISLRVTKALPSDAWAFLLDVMPSYVGFLTP